MTESIPTHSAIESALSTLQPIRDLSRNWDVDIATCLEEYLQDLIGLSGSQLAQVQTASLSAQDEARGDIPNFAQAAIILQNSSHVYSRKVEYLHGLVYKALYEFFKSASGTSKESRQKSQDSAIDEFYDFDVNEDFLLLDDVVPEDFTKAKINLKEEDDEMDALSGSGTPANQSLTRTRLSLGGLSVTRVERSSLGGIASSSHQRALLGTLNNGNLRLVDGLCDVGEDGVLLMPGSQIATPSAPVGFPRDSVETGRSLFGEEPGAAVDFQFATEGDFDDHSTGHGFALHDDDVDDGAAAMMNDGDVEIGVVAHAGHMMTKRVTFAETANKPTRDDPWALLDPHSTDGFNPKPLRKAKTYVLPKGIDLPPSECVTGASTRRVVNRINTEIKTQAPKSIIIESLEAMLGKRKEYPGIPFSGLVFGDEFLYLAKQHANLKASQRRAERKQRLEQQESPNLRVQAEFTDDDDDDDNDGAGLDFGVGGDNDDNDNDDFGNAGLSSLDEAFEGKQAGEESHLGKTFEELCRAHIRAFAKGAEDFAFSTKLTERVSMWQAKLSPILEDEERRAAFDIHRYSQDLLETAKQGLQRIKRKSDGSENLASTAVSFDVVTKNCTQSDVCRLFLTSLSLANSGNILIQEEAAVFTFDLISSNFEQPLETYRAPSTVENP